AGRPARAARRPAGRAPAPARRPPAPGSTAAGSTPAGRRPAGPPVPARRTSGGTYRSSPTTPIPAAPPRSTSVSLTFLSLPAGLARNGSCSCRVAGRGAITARRFSVKAKRLGHGERGAPRSGQRRLLDRRHVALDLLDHRRRHVHPRRLLDPL